MPLQGGTKIFIRTMQDDLKGLQPQKVVLETKAIKTIKKAPPPPKLPVQQTPKIVEKIKIVEKPVIKIKEVIKRVEVPVIKEKIVEKVVEKRVFVNKSKKLKQIIIILILLAILSAISLGAYYLLALPGQEIVITQPEESEPIIEEPEILPQTGLLPNIPQIIQTKTDLELNLPKNLTFDDYNLLIFSDQSKGLVLKVDNALSALAEMTFWEAKMPQDLTILSPVLSQAKFRVNNWEYPNMIIRYQNTSDLSNSLHYALINNKLIITTSEQNMRLIINALLHES